MGLLLGLSRNIVRLHASVSGGEWDYKICDRPERLSTQTLGIIGLGRIGTQVALRAQALGLTVLACDPYVDEATMAGRGVRRVGLLEALGADYVSVHCILTSETRHVIDEAALSLMKPTAYLINTARGGCVDTDALAAALRDGRLAGAGLDVLDPEPAPSGHPIYSLPNVIITPHAAFYSSTAEEEGRRRCCEEVVSVLRGQVPRHVCNPDVLSRPSLRLAAVAAAGSAKSPT
jgi:D-3-phosphoglycerate dehydrogenase